MKLFLFLLAISTALCDTFTSIALAEANCVLVLQYYNSTSFNLLTCYQFKKAIELTTLWDDCTKKCCNPEKVYEQVSSSLDNCDQDRKDYNKANQKDSSQQSKTKDIMFYIVNGLLLLIIVWLAIGISCCRSALREPIQQLLHQRTLEEPINPSVPVYRIEFELEASQNPFRPQAIIEWIQQSRKNEACPICLFGDTEIELATCKHMVHWECWKEWSARKNQCAICRSDDVSQLKIFCYNCKGAYFTCRNEDLQRQLAFPKLVCNECKGHNLTQ